MTTQEIKLKIHEEDDLYSPLDLDQELLVFLALWFFLSVQSESVSAIKAEILSITGWVAIREAASIAIMERPELVILKKAYDRILNARIIFHTATE